jgi:hypothetical protein
MIRKLSRRVIRFILPLALFLGWSGVAHSQLFYTVHQTTSRVLIASEECNGECHIEKETLGSRGFIRLLCGIDDDESIPNGFILATFIACDEHPSAMISVWDRRNEEHVCNGFDMGVVSGAYQDTGEERGKAEFLYAAQGPPLFVSALARYAPLPRRLELEESCWSGYRTRSVAGALEEDVVIMGGRLRAGPAIALYGGGER